MIGWHYVESGLIEDKTVGPVSDEHLLLLAFDGKIKLDTKVTNTKGQWTTVAHVPGLRKKWDDGDAQRKRRSIDGPDVAPSALAVNWRVDPHAAIKIKRQLADDCGCSR